MDLEDAKNDENVQETERKMESDKVRYCPMSVGSRQDLYSCYEEE